MLGQMDIERQSGIRELFYMAGPIILGTLSFTLMQFTDTWIVSRLGDDAMAAVGTAGLWTFTLSTFFLGLVGCVSTFAAQSLGRGNRPDCASYTWQAIYIAIATGLMALIFWPFADTIIFRYMPHSQEVLRFESVYFKVRLASFAFIAWQTALSSFFQAVNKPTVPMYIGLLAAGVNAPLDFLFVFGWHGYFQWGVAGAAIATNVALGLQVFLLQWVFLTGRFREEFGTRHTWRLDMVKVREFLYIGWPGGLTFLVDVFNWTIFTTFLVGGYGTVSLSAHTATVTIMQVSFMPIVGLGHAITPIVGQWLGRGSIAIAKARTYLAMRIGMVYMGMVGLLFIFFGDVLIHIFSQDPQVIRLGRILLILAGLFQAFDAVNIVCICALRGVGDTRWMMGAFFIVGYLIFIPTAYLLASYFNLEAIGAWIGATTYIIILSGVLFWRFYSDGWRHVRIFERDRLAEEVE